jgi:hypothetical protein
VIPVDWLKVGKWGAVLAIAVALWAHGYSKGNDAGDVAVAELRTDHADTLLAIANRSKQVAELARKAEFALGEDLAAIDTKHQEAMRHASQDARDSVLADLRAGRLVVRQPSACGRLPATGTPAVAAGISNGASDNGGGDALDLAIAETVGIAARADERIEACQAVIAAYVAASATGTGKP